MFESIKILSDDTIIKICNIFFGQSLIYILFGFIVRPIKASDEKALESAIAMANALASKSMHDIDKKSMDHFYEHSPGRSPITPNSPAKKFSFFFPNKSPKSERKPFSETASKDIASCLSDQEKDAYR